MSKGNTEIMSEDTSVTQTPDIPETQEPSEPEETGQAAEETETADRSVDGKAPVTAETNPPSLEEDTADKLQSEAYEKLYTEILEHFRSFSPSEQIAGKITEEHITEYLEASREERTQQYRERREKRLIAALELFAILGTILATVNFLRNDPAILVNILYIIGALGAFFLWKHPRDKEDKK